MTNFLDRLDDLPPGDTVVLGDLNVDFLKWDNPLPRQVDLVNCMKDRLEMGGFGQMVRGWTRADQGGARTLIDHIWLNNPLRHVSTSNTLSGASDHNFLDLVIRNKQCHVPQSTFSFRDRMGMDTQGYLDNLRAVDWEPIYLLDNIDLINDFIVNAVKEAVDKYAPLRTIHPSGKKQPLV